MKRTLSIGAGSLILIGLTGTPADASAAAAHSIAATEPAQEPTPTATPEPSQTGNEQEARNPLWRIAARLEPNDGDKGGISTGISSWMYHNEGNEVFAGFNAKREMLILRNSATKPYAYACLTVRADGYGSKQICAHGGRTVTFDWSAPEGHTTAVRLHIGDGKVTWVDYTKKGGRT